MDPYFISFRTGLNRHSALRIPLAIVIFFTVLIGGFIGLMRVKEFVPFFDTFLEFFVLILFVLGIGVAAKVLSGLFPEDPSHFLRFHADHATTIWAPKAGSRVRHELSADKFYKATTSWVKYRDGRKRGRIPRQWLLSFSGPDEADPDLAAQPGISTRFYELGIDNDRLICNVVNVEYHDDHADRQETRYWPK